MAINLYTEGVRLPFQGISKKKAGAWAAAVARELNLENSDIAVILTDNETMKAINKKYRGRNRPTDVISFRYADGPLPGMGHHDPGSGDIFISLEKCRERAVSGKVTVEGEIKRLLVHGVLHLAGYDHEGSRRREAAMRRKEDEVLAAIS